MNIFQNLRIEYCVMIKSEKVKGIMNKWGPITSVPPTIKSI